MFINTYSAIVELQFKKTAQKFVRGGERTTKNIDVADQNDRSVDIEMYEKFSNGPHYVFA